MNMRGPTGEIRYGYQVAAKLGSWELTPKTDDAMFFTATAVAVDDYWITQEPLVLALRFSRSQWLWTGIVAIRDGRYIHTTVTGKPIIEPV